MKYQIEVKETLSKIVVVDAVDESKAIDMVKKNYKSEKLILDYDNYISTEFFVCNK